MKIVALAGGVGGAKLAHGLTQIIHPEDLTIVVNTGDDFEHFCLYISPDLDTVCYTLAGMANPVTGWGRNEESWQAIENAKKLGGPEWFSLGDQDLGTHLERTRRLHNGQTLSSITRDFCATWGVKHSVLPMTDQRVRTLVDTVEHGLLGFQEYFVQKRCQPKVQGFFFDGVENARAAPGVLKALETADAVVICPSNPWVSIDPILAISEIRSTVEIKPVVAISPIIGGGTVKGPAAKMFSEMGIEASALAVAQHYQAFLHGFILDNIDEALEPRFEIPTLTTDTLMISLTKRARLAEDVLNFTRRLL